MVFLVQEPVFRHDDVAIYVDAIIVVLMVLFSSSGIILKAQVLLSVHVEPNVIVVILLLHETLLYNDRENVADHASCDKDVGIEVKLGGKLIDLDHVVISIPDHIAVHQGEKGVARDREVRKSPALPEVRDS